MFFVFYSVCKLLRGKHVTKIYRKSCLDKIKILSLYNACDSKLLWKKKSTSEQIVNYKIFVVQIYFEQDISMCCVGIQVIILWLEPQTYWNNKMLQIK